MERSKLIVSVAVGFAAVFIVWRVGFYPPVPQPAEKPAETVVVSQSEEPVEFAKSGEANEPVVASDVNEPVRLADAGEGRGPGRFTGFEGRIGPPSQSGRITDVNDANEPMEFVNLKDVEMKNIIQKLAEWTGKTVIPNDEAMKQRITVYAPGKLPRNKALARIYSALLMKGYVAEHADDTIYLKPIADAKLGMVPTIEASQPLASIENKDQIVQRFFKLANYSPSQMGQVIAPLVGEHGHVSADETTSSVLVIDTVSNLMRVERIITELDVAQAEQIVTEIFEIRHGDPQEIVQLLQTLLGTGSTSTRGRSLDSRDSRDFRPPMMGPRPMPVSSSSSSSKPEKSKSGGKGTASSVTVGTGQTPMVLIAEAKFKWIIAKASPQDMEQIRQWIDKLDRSVPTVSVDYPLASIENKNQIVQYFFKLKNYSPAEMVQVVGPLLSDNGYVSADENTSQLLVIDTVENLMRIEMIIAQFDVPEAEQAVTEIFEVRYGDPSEIVQMLRILLGESEGYSSTSRSRSRSSRPGYSSGYDRGSSYYSRGEGSSYSPRPSFASGSSYRGSFGTGAASSVVVGTTRGPVVLIPEPRRKWIIAKASAEDIKQISEWIDKLDMEEPVESEYEVVALMYADPSEVQDSVENGFRDLPGTEFLPSVLIEPLEETRQVIVFGRKDLREIVKKMIEEIDIPPGQFETKHFKLKYADPDQVKTNIEELFGEQSLTTGSRYTSIYYYGGRGSRGTAAPSANTVKVISYLSLKQVTVIASPENMEEIAKHIAEWDAPLDVNEVKPRIIELMNCDPVQMADLLKTLFSEQSSSGRVSIYDILFGTGAADKQKIVGPLYGQLTFEEVPGTKKIIVISKIPEAYAVVEAMIRDLDSQEMAEVPRIVQLKYADPEDLSERLNAMFNTPGTSAPIRRSETGLGDYSMDGQQTQTNQSSSTSSNTSRTSTTGGTTTQTATGTYTPWWSGSGARSGTTEEAPISNVIGKIRFVPDPHTKSILVLAPVGFIDKIEELIHQLDIPGKQVMIKAVILEVDHKNLTSLGVQLASSTSQFGTLEENAITALNALTHLERHGALVFGPGNNLAVGATTGGGIQNTNTLSANINVLIDFLIKKVNAKILNQQTLWTKDNEEASFFKGDRIAFQTQMGVTQQTTTQSYEFERVGMTLAVRPSITPEKKVDMIINIILSQLSGDLVNNQPARTEMETETNMIVQDGQTIMLGGILFQKDSIIQRKIPLLGDVPVAGNLFRHNETLQANNELIVFITPFVVDEPGETLPQETAKEIEGPRQKLEDIREELKDTMEELKEKLP